jgi:lipoate---protein ligase
LSGDFTCNPAEGIAALAERLKGESLLPALAVDRIAPAIAALGLDLPGAEPQHFAAAIGACHRRES